MPISAHPKYGPLIREMISELEVVRGIPRAQTVLLQAYLSYIIDEILEILVETDKFRGTSMQFTKKVDYLYDLGWISYKQVDDFKVLDSIRGIMAHRVNIQSEKFKIDFKKLLNQIHMIKDNPKIIERDYDDMKKLNLVSQLLILGLGAIWKMVEDHKKNNSLKRTPRTFQRRPTKS